MSSFKAYIGVDEYEMQNDTKQDSGIGFDAKSELKLLPGEVVISSAQSVLKFTALSQQQGISGAIFITNFKLSFVTADRSSYELVDRCPQTHLLGESDLCLTNIESVYQVLESGRKKKLQAGTSVTSRIEVLQLHCRDFRVHTFCFKFTPRGEEKTLINAILHHSFPPRVQLLFAFEYKAPPTKGNIVGGTRLFTVATNWEDELQRLECNHRWRVSHLNESFRVSKSLSETFVVPSSILDEQLYKAACHFNGNRVPVWCWSNSKGCAILRSAGIHPSITDSQQMAIMLDFIQSTHPEGRKPYLMDLDSQLPNLKEVQQSYCKLRDLCMPESNNQFSEQESRYLTLLENTKWLHYISKCLELSKELAIYIYQNKATVVLQESEDRDFSCLISSLMQIILDPYYRTITGLQNLIQKEWIAMGHPFAHRLGLLRGSENEECPLLLVFLDCVWQMLQQFPAAFEFTETYLTLLWDCSRLSVFDTFLFNSDWERYTAIKERPNPLQTRSLWDWNILFPEETLKLFSNPLYLVSQLAGGNVSSDMPNTDRLIKRKSPVSQVFDAKPSSCYTQSLPRNSHANNGAAANRRSTVTRQSSVLSLNPLSSQKIPTPLIRWKVYQTLPVNTRISALQLWSQCYLRWIPLVQILKGGPPLMFFHRQKLVEEIMCLQRQISALNLGYHTTNKSASNNNLTAEYRITTSTSPLRNEIISSAFPFSPGGSSSVSGLPLMFYRQSSYIASDDELESESTLSLGED